MNFLMILSSGIFKRKMRKTERQKEIHRHTLLAHAYTYAYVVYVDTHILVNACTCIFVCCVYCFVLSFCDCVVLNKAKNVDLEESYLFLLYLYLEKKIVSYHLSELKKALLCSVLL